MCMALFVCTNDLSSLKNNYTPLRLSCVYDDDSKDCVRIEHHERRMYTTTGTDVGITAVPAVTIY